MGYTVVLMIHVLLAAGLIGLILLQHGKGADAGAGFGAGSSGTVFGARGSMNFLSRSTAIFAALFFVSSMTLTHFVHQDTPKSVVESVGTNDAGSSTATMDAKPANENTVNTTSASDSDGLPMIDIDDAAAVSGSTSEMDLSTNDNAAQSDMPLLVVPTDNSN